MTQLLCPLCGSYDTESVGIKKDRITPQHPEIEFDIRQCYGECGVLFSVYPEGWNSHDVYQDDQYHVRRQVQTNHEFYEDRFAHDIDVANQRLSRATAYVDLKHGTKFLDVGCANGALVLAAAGWGCDATGTDISDYIIQKNFQHFGQQGKEQFHIMNCTSGCDALIRFYVHNMDVESIPGGTYDIIQINDVIEHSVNAVEFLKRAADALEVGGVLFVDTPDFDHPNFSKNGLDWHHVKPVEHTLFFTHNALDYVVKAAGLEVVDTYAPIPGKIVVVATKKG